jgi:hypothetical protein
MPTPGDICQTSGIYRVVHDTAHKQPHEITMVQGKTFPPCEIRGCHVSYTLVRKTEHLR